MPTVSLSMLEFLSWVSARPRTYGDVMEAWRTTCPRLSVWEDAVADGLVRLESAGGMRQGRVLLTPRGRAVLDGQRPAARSEPARAPEPAPADFAVKP